METPATTITRHSTRSIQVRLPPKQ